MTSTIIDYKKYYLTSLVLLFSFSIILAQEQKSTLKVYFNPIDYDYWWLQKNNYGKSIISKEIEYEWYLKKSKTTYKINLSNAYKENEKPDFGESFIKHNFSEKTFLRVGKYYRDFSQYLNDNLSSGSMLISKNTQAMPKIGLVTSQNIIKKNQGITFNFGIAHGAFSKDNYYTKAPFLHEKFIYIHVEKDNYQISFGFVHEAMWGGATSGEEEWPLKKSSNLWKDFLKILIAGDGPLNDDPPPANSIGNHLGIWDFSYQKKYNNQILKLYYQHFFEDTSSLRFRNEIDGLWGAELTNYIPNTTILLEYLDTTNSFLDPPYQSDIYYGNYQYRLGWKYGNNIIGNPFVNTSWDPINNSGDVEFTKLFHIGISGEISSNYYELKASKKINMNDTIRYKIKIGKIVKDKFDFNIFIVNNEETNGLGISISYFAKNF